MADEHWKQSIGEQHHQRAYRLELNWYEGNITKYAERCRLKGTWLDDVLKVVDYSVLYMESRELVNEPTQVQADKMKDIAQRLYDLAAIANEWERRQMNLANTAPLKE